MTDDQAAGLASEVAEFVAGIADEQQRADTLALIAMMERHTGKPAAKWGTIIGFGKINYRYPTGNSGTTFITGFAPRKTSLSLHVLWYPDEDDPLLAALGKHKRGKGCLYIKRLDNVDLNVLDKIIRRAATDLRDRFVVED